MRVFIAGFCHESSSFSPIPTSRRSFEEFEYYRPNGGAADEKALALNGYGAFIRRALDDGATPLLSTYTFAQPSGPIVRADYESLREEILGDLRGAGPVDAVLLFLHGAQMAVGYDDCEGDFLRCARDIVGPGVFIGALLDLHANVTKTMMEEADALVACRHYPHIDFNERGEHLYDLAKATISGQIKPRMHYRFLPMMGMYYTTAPEMKTVNAAALDVQNADGVASVSLIHGFPWTDIPHVGAGVLIITENSDIDVSVEAERLAEMFFKTRSETKSMRVGVDEALNIAEANAETARPVVIADTADNPGGGAPSDSTFILSRLLERGLNGYAVGIFWDQVAVQMAFDIGEGATFKLRLGGKCGPASGAPLDVTATVKKLCRGMTQEGIGYTHPMGDAVLFEIDGNYVVASTVRGQVFSPTCFTDFGVDVASIKGVVVKSSQHFYDQFAPLAQAVVYCDTPGALTLEFTEDMFTQPPRPIWPLDEIEAV